MCGCNDGRLTCTDIEECKEGEERDEDDRKCEKCQDAPMSLVCGRDGRTFKSWCIAMNCSRLRDIDILNRPCPSQVSQNSPTSSLSLSLSLSSLSLSLLHFLCHYRMSVLCTHADLAMHAYLLEDVPVCERKVAHLMRKDTVVRTDFVCATSRLHFMFNLFTINFFEKKTHASHVALSVCLKNKYHVTVEVWELVGR